MASAPTPPPPTPGSKANQPQGNPAKRKFFYNQLFANKKKSSEYHDKPYSFLLTDNTVRNSFRAIVNKGKSTEHLPGGWKLYFHEDDDVKDLDPEQILRKVRLYRDYLKRPTSSPIDYAQLQDVCTFPVDVDVLEESSEWKCFSQDLQKRPEHTLACLSFAMHLQLNEVASTMKRQPKYLALLSPRIKNLDLPVSRINSLSFEDCGRLVRIRGTVIQESDDSIDFIWRVFVCGRCDTRQVVLQRDNKKCVPPNHCDACKQRSSDYSEDIHSYFNCFVQSQSLRVQDTRTTGVTPGKLEIVVREDLVNKIGPGNEVMCLGVLKTRVEGVQDRQYTLYLDVVDVEWNDDSDDRNFDYSASDYAIIDRVRADSRNALRLLVNSLCPKIIGQEMIKAAVLLGLFSCSPMDYADKWRREAHVLLVGDPGLGKSEILEACSFVAPRGIFVSSNNCSNTGLTATMGNDSGKSCLEAGALVMADQGVCCIDELDKINAHTDVLLEAMEDQIVNVSKAGVINKLQSKTAILAAANPIGGHYNKLKLLMDNMKVSSAIVSRFDLVLVLIDQTVAPPLRKEHEEEHSSNLQSRLKMNGREMATFEPLPATSFRKLISYVNRKYVPELSKDAQDRIKEYFLVVRDRPFYCDTITATYRTLPSLMRLTQARAKIDLCAVATKKHVEDVIALMEFGMEDVANIREQDIVIQANMQNKEPNLSRAKQLSNFTRMLVIRTKDTRGDTRVSNFDKAELKELAARAGVRNFNEILDLMNHNGVLLHKGGDQYQFVNY